MDKVDLDYMEAEKAYLAILSALDDEYRLQRSKIVETFAPIAERYKRDRHGGEYARMMARLATNDLEAEALKQERNQAARAQAAENARLETERLAVIERKLAAGGFSP